MKKILIPILAGLIVLLNACRKEGPFLEEGMLTFSDEVITFDTLFTGYESPTGRVMVYNNTDNNILISEISLEAGAGSDFALTIDGIDSSHVHDLEIPSGDSLLVLIRYQTSITDDYTHDRIIFRVGSWTGDVEIQGFAQNAVFLSDTVIWGVQTWDATKKYVLDGAVIVGPNSMLTIPAGTQLYFTPRKDEDFNFISRLEIWGTLKANGVLGNEVVFKQTRWGEDYEETAGQWRGIRFYSPSKNSEMTHCLVKNAVIGIEVDSITNGINTKLTLDRCEVRNCAAYGILGLGYSFASLRPMIDARGCLFHNCKEGTFYAFGGGWYEFKNCTFANYTLDFIRNAPQIGINNFYEDYGLSYYCTTNFKNCIIWGSEEEEVVFDTSAVEGIFDVYFNTCLVRHNEVPIKGANNLTANYDTYPEFIDPFDGDPANRSYRLQFDSPALNAGDDLSIYLNYDLDDWNRGTNPPMDIGCYEYH